MSVKENIMKFFVKSYARLTGVAQGQQVGQGDYSVTEGMPELLRAAAAEGAVLLENRVLPFKKDSTVSVFGRTQLDWFYTGYGSGGDVIRPYQVNLVDGIRNCGKLNINKNLLSVYEKWVAENPVDHGAWGFWPRSYPEMPLLNTVVAEAAKQSDYAVVVIGRSSGEDRENVLEKGSYFLTDDELDMLTKVTENFKDTVVLLNIGSIIDLSWIEEMRDRLGAVMIVWQGGMESGNAVADLLCGDEVPSGRLSETVARDYNDYPSSAFFGNKDYNEYKEDIYVGYRWFETFDKASVLYPFGHGLSYTEFKITNTAVKYTPDGLKIAAAIKNTGDTYAGKYAVCAFLEKPCGVLGNPSRELVDFAKTDVIYPNQTENLLLSIGKEQLASYDSSGKTGNKSCYVVEKGVYRIYLGSDVRSAEKIFEFSVSENIVVERLKEVCAPKYPFEIYKSVEDEKTGRRADFDIAPASSVNLRQTILDNLPADIPQTEDRGYKLKDVAEGKVSLDDFVAQLSLDELEAITRGDYIMNSPLGANGNAGVFGGVLESLREKGVTPVTTTDGPSGIRLKASCSLIPIGSSLASTFNKELVKEVYYKVGCEMKDRGSDVLLAPGMNIKRNVLCGRNFEYFSEDPILTGKIAAAAVTGLQKAGVSACPKHFACNNQEYNRLHNDSRVSERALREIYLKGFEICVKTAKPHCIMTSYNKINGVWGHYNYELCARILRQEWGFDGLVMTDWWMRSSRSPEFPDMKDNAYRVRAQVDLLMPGGRRVGRKKPDGTLLQTLGKTQGITLGEIQLCAKHVLTAVMRSNTFRLNNDTDTKGTVS
jgi:beta-glucosidase